ncbi:MAG: thioesterase [Streptococcaceae bacterium]|nr:thioesterase [Streptococcaceae bacterium]
MGKKYKKTYSVPFYESSANKSMKLSQVLAVALQASGEQSTNLGMSDDWLAEKYNCFWAIISYDITIHRLPKFLEKIEIITEAKSYNKFFCYRQFTFLSEDGTPLVEMNTTWIIMNKENRKVERVQDDIVAPYESEKTTKIIRPYKFKKLENTQQQKYQVTFSDLDMNGHVNNAKYLEWVIDQLGHDFLMTHEPESIHINYHHEILPESIIIIFTEKNDNISYHTINERDVEIEIEWKKI